MLASHENFSLTTDCPEDYSYQDTSCFDFAAQDQTYYHDQSAKPLAISSKKINKERKKKRASRAKHYGRKEKSFWQPEEDAQVLELIGQFGLKWTKIGRIIGGRTGKQVRDRYNHALNPNIRKEKWTEQEDEMLFFLYQQIGNKWCQIAQQMPGRTENQIKNRFHSKLKCLTDKKGSASCSEIAQKSPSDSGELSPLTNSKGLAEVEQPSDLRGMLDRIISRNDLYIDFARDELLDQKEDVYLPECSEPKQEDLPEPVFLSRPSFFTDGGFTDFLITLERENEMNLFNNF